MYYCYNNRRLERNFDIKVSRPKCCFVRCCLKFIKLLFVYVRWWRALWVKPQTTVTLVIISTVLFVHQIVAVPLSDQDTIDYGPESPEEFYIVNYDADYWLTWLGSWFFTLHFTCWNLSIYRFRHRCSLYKKGHRYLNTGVTVPSIDHLLFNGTLNALNTLSKFRREKNHVYLYIFSQTSRLWKQILKQISQKYLIRKYEPEPHLCRFLDSSTGIEVSIIINILSS